MPPTIAVLDSDADTTEMLRLVLENRGFLVVTGNLARFRTGADSVSEFLTRAAPDVILYDLGIPYESNWEFLESMRRDPAFASRGLVITTTNERAVRTLLGIEAIELLGKPYDLERVVEAVVNTLATKPPAFTPDGDFERRRQGDRRSGRDRRGR